IRVELAAAVLSRRDDGRLTIEKLGALPLVVNDKTVDSAAVGPGDKIEIGPCAIRITEPAAGTDVALEVELAPSAEGAQAALMAQAQGLQRVAISKRAMSWSAFVVLAVVCLVVPLALYSANLIPAWKKGGQHTTGPITV